MEVYLVRHTTPIVAKGVCYGQTDLDVATTFEEEVMVTLSNLPDQFDMVYTSPLKRCRQLAERIDENCILENRLMELNFGDWEMKKWDDIPLKEIQPWFDNYVDNPALNGESFMDLFNRTHEFLDEIKQHHLKRVAIVAHAGVIRTVLSKYNEIALKDVFSEIEVGYGSVSRITID